MICQKCVGTHLDLSTYGANPRIFVEFEVFSDGSDLRKGLNPAVGMKLGKTIELNPWVTAVRSALAADHAAKDHVTFHKSLRNFFKKEPVVKMFVIIFFTTS